MNEIFILITIIILTIIVILACIKTIFSIIFINKKLMQQAMINDTMQDVISSIYKEINDMKRANNIKGLQE